MKGSTERARTRRAGILVLVLVLLGLITGLVAQALISARATVRREEMRLRASRLQAALADTARHAIQLLAEDENLDVDHLQEPWASVQDVRHPSGVSTWVRITDENQRFDLNNLYLENPGSAGLPAREIVMNIMTLCGDFGPLERVQALEDWIDPDDEGFHESAFYAELESPYRCPNTWLASWSELLYVNGFTREYFARHERVGSRDVFQADLVDCLTAIPGRHERPVPINVNTAPRDVLLGILGLAQDQLVQYIVVLREEHPLVSLEAVAAVADPLLLAGVRPYLDVKSSVFRIEVRAFEAGQAAQLWVLVSRDDQGQVTVLRWVS